MFALALLAFEICDPVNVLKDLQSQHNITVQDFNLEPYSFLDPCCCELNVSTPLTPFSLRFFFLITLLHSVSVI